MHLKLTRWVSWSTLLLVGIILFALLLIGPLNSSLGKVLWDGIALQIYEALGLFRIRHVFSFLTLWVLVGYLFSRQIIWRYTLNRWAIRVVPLYWRMDSNGRIYETLRFLSRGRINRRYAAAIRAHLDTDTQVCHRHVWQAMAGQVIPQTTIDRAWVNYQKHLGLWQRHLWPHRFLQPSATAVYGLLTASQEELALIVERTHHPGLSLPQEVLRRHFDEMTDLTRYLGDKELQTEVCLHLKSLHKLLSTEETGIAEIAVPRHWKEIVESIRRAIAIIELADDRPALLPAILAYHHTMLEMIVLLSYGAAQETIEIANLFEDTLFLRLNRIKQQNRPPGPWESLGKRYLFGKRQEQVTRAETHLPRLEQSVPDEMEAMLLVPNRYIWYHSLQARAWNMMHNSLRAMHDASPEPQRTSSQNSRRTMQAYAAYCRQESSQEISSAQAEARKGFVKSDAGYPLFERNLEDRMIRIGGVWHLPGEKQEAQKALWEGPAWFRLATDPWKGSVVAILATLLVTVACVLPWLGLHVFGILPHPVQWVHDLRVATEYNEYSLTDGAQVGDWIVVGSQGGGVQTYHTDSGIMGLWNSYTQKTTQGALSNDFVQHIAVNGQGVWYNMARGSLAWSDSTFREWQTIIGSRGFMPLQPGDIREVTFSPDERYFILVTQDEQIGVYDTREHDWLGAIPADGTGEQILDVLVDSLGLWIASSGGIRFFRFEPSPAGTTLQLDPELTLSGQHVAQLAKTPEWILAQTEGHGLLGLDLSSRDPSWRWIIDESRFQTPQPLQLHEVSAAVVEGDTLWMGAQGFVGRYDTVSRSWQTFGPDDGLDGSQVSQLAAFDGEIWAGTLDGLYKLTSHEPPWEAIPSVKGLGIAQLLPIPDRLWIITQENSLGYLTKADKWHLVAGGTRFDESGQEPIVTDIVAKDGTFWVASANLGISSYDVAHHQWQRRITGLPSGPNTSVAQLLNTPDGIWCLAQAGNEYRPMLLKPDGWETVVAKNVQHLAYHNDAVWMKTDSGEVLRWKSNGIETFFGAESFDPASFQAFYYEQQTNRILVASSEGLLAYDLDSHSWSWLLRERAVADVISVSGLVIWQADDGSLWRLGQEQPTLPGDGVEELPDDFWPTTATTDGQDIWMGGRDILLQYSPAVHRLRRHAVPSGMEIRQLRASASWLWVLTSDPDQTNRLWLYDVRDESWLQVDDNSQVKGMAVSGATAAYFTDAHLCLATPAEDHIERVDYFSGTFTDLDDPLKQVVQTSENEMALWLVSEQGHVGKYLPDRGLWIQFDTPPIKEIAHIREGTGEWILAASEEGIFVAPATALRPNEFGKVSTESVIGLAIGQDYTYILSKTGTGLGLSRWRDSRIEQIGMFADPETKDLYDLEWADGQLWALSATAATSLQILDDQVTIQSVASLPVEVVATAAVRLVAPWDQSQGNVILFAGTPSICYQLDRAQGWLPCQYPTLLAQPISERIVRDEHWGRYEFQRAPLGAYLNSSFLAGDHFSTDRVRAVRLDPAGVLHLLADSFVWQARIVEQGTRLQVESGNAVSAEGIDEFNQMTIESLSVSGDPWHWVRRHDPVTQEDSISITWPESPDLSRRFYQGQFADETVYAVAAYRDHLWLGTELGLFQADISDSALTNMHFIPLQSDKSVSTLVATDESLFVEYSDGQVWKNSNDLWNSSEGFPELLGRVKDDSVQKDLIWETAAGIGYAPMISQNRTSRFEHDQILALESVNDDLWAATSLGMLQVRGDSQTLQVSRFYALFPEDSHAGSAALQVSGDQVFTRFELDQAIVEIMCYDQACTSTGNVPSPFDQAFPLAEQVSGSNLLWVQLPGDNAHIVPYLGQRPVPWVEGRLGLDYLNDLAVWDNTLWLATAAGPLSYEISDGLEQTTSIPGGGLPLSVFIDVHADTSSVLAENTNGEVYQLAVVREGITDWQVGNAAGYTTMPKQTILFSDGRWQQTWRERAKADSILQIDGMESNAQLMTQDGRFVFDAVNDLAADTHTGNLGLATSGGLQFYEVTPLQQPSGWDIRWGDVQDIEYDFGRWWLLTDDGIYSRQASEVEWMPDPRWEPFWPDLAYLSAEGWRRIKADPAAVDPRIRVEGLGQDAELFAPSGKFTFDEVKYVVGGKAKTWLITEAGLVSATYDQANGIIEFAVFGTTQDQLPISVERADHRADGKIDIWGTDHAGAIIQTTWSTDGGIPQLVAAGTRSNIPGVMAAANYNVLYDIQRGLVWDDRQGHGLSFSESRSGFFRTASISEVSTLIVDSDGAWAITPEALISMNMHQIRRYMGKKSR